MSAHQNSSDRLPNCSTMDIDCPIFELRFQLTISCSVVLPQLGKASLQSPVIRFPCMSYPSNSAWWWTNYLVAYYRRAAFDRSCSIVKVLVVEDHQPRDLEQNAEDSNVVTSSIWFKVVPQSLTRLNVYLVHCNHDDFPYKLCLRRWIFTRAYYDACYHRSTSHHIMHIYTLLQFIIMYVWGKGSQLPVRSPCCIEGSTNGYGRGRAERGRNIAYLVASSSVCGITKRKGWWSWSIMYHATIIVSCQAYWTSCILRWTNRTNRHLWLLIIRQAWHLPVVLYV